VNENLRELIASLRTEKERLAAGSRTLSAASHTPPPVTSAAPDALGLDRTQLLSDLEASRSGLAEVSAERALLNERLGRIEAENARLRHEYSALQEKTLEAAKLFVALERLHAGKSRVDALAALRDIVTNLIGSEELAIFERRDDVLVLVESCGIDPEPLRQVALGVGAIGRAVRTGSTYLTGQGSPVGGHDERLTACIPLKIGDETAGAIAIFRLLGHKAGLAASDHAVFDLLTAHAALALNLRDPSDPEVAARSS
jgi:hypothetical protein